MNSSEYKAIRKTIGSPAFVAKFLDIPISLIADRETGASPIPREAALALELLSEIAMQQTANWSDFVAKQTECENTVPELAGSIAAE